MVQTSATNLISRIASSTTLDKAFAWLAHKRVVAHFNNPLWQVTSRWSSIRNRLRRQLQAGEYHFSPQQLTLAVSSWQRFKLKWQLRHAPQSRLLQTLKNWSRWATIGVPVNLAALLTTITSFLPPQLIQAATNTFVPR